MQQSRSVCISWAFLLNLLCLSGAVSAVSGRPALNPAFPLQRRSGPGCGSSRRKHGSRSRAGRRASQHHWRRVRSHGANTNGVGKPYCGSDRTEHTFLFLRDDLEFPRSWLIPVIRDHVKNTRLAFFTSYFLPLASTLKQKGKYLKLHLKKKKN